MTNIFLQCDGLRGAQVPGEGVRGAEITGEGVRGAEITGEGVRGARITGLNKKKYIDSVKMSQKWSPSNPVIIKQQ